VKKRERGPIPGSTGEEVAPDPCLHVVERGKKWTALKNENLKI
jgi:hypothetical protein